jgi:hypothetical protein
MVVSYTIVSQTQQSRDFEMPSPPPSTHPSTPPCHSKCCMRVWFVVNAPADDPSLVFDSSEDVAVLEARREGALEGPGRFTVDGNTSFAISANTCVSGRQETEGIGQEQVM